MNKQQLKYLYGILLNIAKDITQENSTNKSMFLACVNLGKLISWVDIMLEDMEDDKEEDEGIDGN